MRLEYWLYFESSGEKERLKEVVNNATSEIDAISKIQETFNMSLSDAYEVLNIFKNKLKV